MRQKRLVIMGAVFYAHLIIISAVNFSTKNTEPVCTRSHQTITDPMIKQTLFDDLQNSFNQYDQVTNDKASDTIPGYTNRFYKKHQKPPFSEFSCSSESLVKQFEKNFLRSSSRIPPQEADDLLLSMQITRANWKAIFSYLCWPELLNEYGTCTENQNEQIDSSMLYTYNSTKCSLMDFFFASRHYHPYAGFSMWSRTDNSKTLHGQYTLPRVILSKDLLSSNPSSAQMSTNHYINELLTRKLINTIVHYFHLSNSDQNSHQILGIFGLFVLFGLFVSLFIYVCINHSFRKALDSFNLRMHMRTLCEIPKHTSEDRFFFFEFIRVTSMFWVFIGHSVLYWLAFLPFDRAVKEFVEASKNPLNYPFVLAVFAVDNFLFLSGFLTSYYFYGYLVQLKKDMHSRWPNSYSKKVLRLTILFFSSLGQRYFRIMGTALFILFSYLALNCVNMPLPTGSRYLQATNVACQDNIISIIALVNNVAQHEFVHECFNWTWYLANDYQFFILSLCLIYVAVFASKRVFNVLFWTILIGNIWLTQRIALRYKLNVSLDTLERGWHHAGYFISDRWYFPLHPLMDYFYVKPWVRVGPSLLGLILGMCLSKCKELTKQHCSKLAAELQVVTTISRPFSQIAQSAKQAVNRYDNLLHSVKPRSQENEAQSCLKNFTSILPLKDKNDNVLKKNTECKDLSTENCDASENKLDDNTSLKTQQLNHSDTEDHCMSNNKNLISDEGCRIIQRDSCDMNRKNIVERMRVNFLTEKRDRLNRRTVGRAVASCANKPQCKMRSNSIAAYVDKNDYSQKILRSNNEFQNFCNNKSSKFNPSKYFTLNHSVTTVSQSFIHNESITTVPSLSSSDISSEASSPSLSFEMSNVGKIENDSVILPEQAQKSAEWMSSLAPASVIFDSQFLPFPYQELVCNYPYLLFLSLFVIPSILVYYGHYTSRTPSYEWRAGIDAWYMALQRPLWAVMLTSLTLLLVFHGEYKTGSRSRIYKILRPVKQFTCSPQWIPLARLSYCIYLCHPIVLFAFYGRGYGPKQFGRSQLLFCFLLSSLMSVTAAIVVYVLVESPLKYLVTVAFQKKTGKTVEIEHLQTRKPKEA